MSVDAMVWEGENPFAEEAAAAAQPRGFASWESGPSPFEEFPAGAVTGERFADELAEALDELRDEEFGAVLDDLVRETEAAIGARVDEEAFGVSAERERIGAAHLQPVELEAERYLDRLAQEVGGIDVGALSDEQFDQLLDGLDPDVEGLSPASEDFLGGLIKKAKKAVKSIAKKARKVVSKVAGGLLGPALKKLKGLVRPLIRRVLTFAIGKLPSSLQGPARALARKLRLEAELEWGGDLGEAGAGADAVTSAVPALPADLALEFELEVARIVAEPDGAADPAFAGESAALVAEEDELEGDMAEQLARARGRLIDELRAAEDGADVAPAIENFVPAIMAALKIGLKIIGRKRVVSFLAKYLASLIKGFVGPQLARPLATSMVDAGLRLVSLEAEGVDEAEAGAVAIASAVEDTVRRVAELDEATLDDDELLQLATAEAFADAVATSFPAALVKRGVQQAPSLGGSFVTRGVRGRRPYRRYSRVPEVELSEQIAEALPAFGGGTVLDELEAAGVGLPTQARVHVFEAIPGTTVAGLAESDARIAPAVRMGLHPLTPGAAGVLLREPRLGVAVPRRFMGAEGRLAAGQRLYAIEPIEPIAAGALGGESEAERRRARRPRGSRTLLVLDVRRKRLSVAVYLSEREAQRIAADVRRGPSASALLTALSRAFGRLRLSPGSRSIVVAASVSESEDLLGGALSAVAGAVTSAATTGIRRQLRRWFLAGAARWARERSAEFVRAVDYPASGVTIRVSANGVAGVGALGAVMNGKGSAADVARIAGGALLDGAAAASVTIVPGWSPR